MQTNTLNTGPDRAGENDISLKEIGEAPGDDFFRQLPAVENYADVTKAENFRPAPLDWYVVITDVVNSTGAIESGHYKNVNVLGATTIIGLLNVAGAIEFPFVFGGDGASFLIPPALLPAAKRVLASAKNRARQAFQLELRAGIVPVKKVVDDGYPISVAKLKVSDHFAQAVFAGGGISHAEKLIKRPIDGESYELKSDEAAADADFSGLECRWSPIPSDKGEIVSLLIQARGENDSEKNGVYQEVIQRIESIFGHKNNYHPVSQRGMQLSSKSSDLLTELRTKKGQRPWHVEFRDVARMLFNSLVGRILFKKRLHFGGVDWGNYQDVLIQNTDYQKFDDMIRMVISSSTEDRKAFEVYLGQEREKGRLVYGLHITDRALLTCLVFDRHNRHFHFVDGSDGGYALAAKTLKKQLKAC